MTTNYDGRISAKCKEECQEGECGCPRTVDGCGGCCGCLTGCVEGYAEQVAEADALFPEPEHTVDRGGLL